MDGNKKFNRFSTGKNTDGGQDLSGLVEDNKTIWPSSFAPLPTPSQEARAAGGKDPGKGSCGINFTVGSKKEAKPSALADVHCESVNRECASSVFDVCGDEEKHQ